MPRGKLTKVDILSKLYRMKTDLYDNSRMKSLEWNSGAHEAINKILDYVNEYSS